MIKRVIRLKIGARAVRYAMFCLLAFAAALYSASEARAQWATNGNNINNTNTGNVGIGTTTPAAKLDVSGTNAAPSSTGAANGVLLVGSPETNLLLSAGVDASANGTYSWLQSRSRVYAGTYYNLTLNPLGGNVGIGTATPTALLNLRVGTGDVVSRFSNAGGAGGGFDIRYKYESSQHRMGLSDANGQWMFYTQYASPNTNSIGFFPGKVGIGTSAPSTALHVVGDVIVTGNLSAKYQDVAEWVPSRQQLAAGTVVVVDASGVNEVLASSAAYDTGVAGVISAQPGIALGERGEGKVLVATTGRVKVKVDATRFPVRAGDLLVTSDVAGVAMRSEPVLVGGVSMHRPGTIIGKALEPLAGGTGEILVLLSLQ